MHRFFWQHLLRLLLKKEVLCKYYKSHLQLSFHTYSSFTSEESQLLPEFQFRLAGHGEDCPKAAQDPSSLQSPSTAVTVPPSEALPASSQYPSILEGFRSLVLCHNLATKEALFLWFTLSKYLLHLQQKARILFFPSERYNQTKFPIL